MFFNSFFLFLIFCFFIFIRLHLEVNPNEYTVFKIFPSYKYQNERDSFVRFQDDVFIASAMENMNKNAYVCLAAKGENRMSPESKTHEEDQSDEENTMGGKFLSKMHDDFMISFDKTTRFK